MNKAFDPLETSKISIDRRKYDALMQEHYECEGYLVQLTKLRKQIGHLVSANELLENQLKLKKMKTKFNSAATPEHKLL